MAHQFTVNETIHGVSIEDFSRLVADTSLHEAVCKRIPGENLEIIESNINGDIYTLRREYNLDVNIPEEQGFKEEFDSSVAIVAGVNQDGKRVLISEAALEKNQLSRDIPVLIDTESNNSKPIEVKDISEVLSGDMSDDTIITTDVGQHQMWVAQRYPFKTYLFLFF